MPTTQNYQRPEGRLIADAARVKRLTGRQAARMAGISDARWRQIVNGYVSVGAGQAVAVVGPAETLARMARVVGVTPDQLRKAGRSDAADLLLTLAGMQAESEWQAVGSALDRLVRIREQLDDVIDELASAPAPIPRPDGSSPRIQVNGAN